MGSRISGCSFRSQNHFPAHRLTVKPQRRPAVCLDDPGALRKEREVRFIRSLESMPGMVTEFSEELRGSMADHVTVRSKDNIAFTLTGGMEIKSLGRPELRRFAFGWSVCFCSGFWQVFMLQFAWVAEEVGTSPAYVSRIGNSREQIVNKTFLAMMDALGYDVRLTYGKRETAE